MRIVFWRGQKPLVVIDEWNGMHLPHKGMKICLPAFLTGDVGKGARRDRAMIYEISDVVMGPSLGEFRSAGEAYPVHVMQGYVESLDVYLAKGKPG